MKKRIKFTRIPVIYAKNDFFSEIMPSKMSKQKDSSCAKPSRFRAPGSSKQEVLPGKKLSKQEEAIQAFEVGDRVAIYIGGLMSRRKYYEFGFVSRKTKITMNISLVKVKRPARHVYGKVTPLWNSWQEEEDVKVRAGKDGDILYQKFFLVEPFDETYTYKMCS